MSITDVPCNRRSVTADELDQLEGPDANYQKVYAGPLQTPMGSCRCTGRESIFRSTRRQRPRCREHHHGQLKDAGDRSAVLEPVYTARRWTAEGEYDIGLSANLAERGAEVAAGVREGDVLAGKYRIDRVLGVGGMGVVVAAHHLQLHTKVAIKFLLPGLMENQDAVNRFAREARAAVRITGEHVARVLDVGELDTGAPYMVMEFLEGIDLAAWLKRSGALPIDQTVDFVLQACVALAEAHVHGIIHRDLKPSNLFCTRRADGQLVVKVLDFGISKSIDVGASAAATATSALMGSPLYMSPEQMQSPKDVNAQADIWALGVILHELLTGTAPFAGDTLPEICFKIAMNPPVPLRSRRPDAPGQLEAIILRCLEKDRGARYPHVGELAIALSRFGSARARPLAERIWGIMQSAGMTGSLPDGQASPSSVLPAPRAEPSGRTSGVRTETFTPVGGPATGTDRRRTVAATLVGLVVVVLGGALAVWTFFRPPPTAPARTEDSVANSAIAVEPSHAAAGAPLPSASLAPLPPGTSAAVASSSLVFDAAAPRTSPPAPAPVAGAPVRRARPAPPAAAAPSHAATATPAPNCNPPYYVDSQGNHVFRAECVN